MKLRYAVMLSALLPMACATTGSATSDRAPAEASEDAQGQGASEQMGPSSATANLESRSGSNVTGTARFTRLDDGQIELTMEIEGATPGTHATHLHEFGDCSAPDASSAGSHWNPTTHPHGQWDHEDGHHLGDLGNIEVGEDGTGSITITTDRWELGTGGMADIVGTAVIVHTSADDFTTQPTGNAGGREACGVVTVDG